MINVYLAITINILTNLIIIIFFYFYFSKKNKEKEKLFTTYLSELDEKNKRLQKRLERLNEIEKKIKSLQNKNEVKGKGNKKKSNKKSF